MTGVRVLLAGDWHGNGEFASRVFALAAEQGCRAVLQLGDFGLWPGREQAWLDRVDHLAGRAGVDLLWIDGNHEDHHSLDRWREQAGPDGIVAMRPHVRWASRGARWDWGGVRFGALGGAVSADRFLRRAGHNWWPQEALRDSDVERLGAGRLDVLATHAAPTSYPPPPRPLRLPPDILRDAADHRRRLDRAVAATRPRQVVHGHYHRRLHADLDGWAIDGLAHDRAPLEEACAVLEAAAGRFEIRDLSLRRPAGPGPRRPPTGPAW